MKFDEEKSQFNFSDHAVLSAFFIMYGHREEYIMRKRKLKTKKIMKTINNYR